MLEIVSLYICNRLQPCFLLSRNICNTEITNVLFSHVANFSHVKPCFKLSVGINPPFPLSVNQENLRMSV